MVGQQTQLRIRRVVPERQRHARHAYRLLSPDYRVPFANRFFEDRFGKSEGKRCYEYLFTAAASRARNCETFKVLQDQSRRTIGSGRGSRLTPEDYRLSTTTRSPTRTARR